MNSGIEMKIGRHNDSFQQRLDEALSFSEKREIFSSQEQHQTLSTSAGGSDKESDEYSQRTRCFLENKASCPLYVVVGYEAMNGLVNVYLSRMDFRLETLR